MLDDILFETQTPLGFSVRVTRNYWEIITSTKHPIMFGKEELVENTISNPDEIRRSSKDDTVFLFYKRSEDYRFVCAVVKRLNGDGFLITAYPTNSIKLGEQLWTK